MSNGILVSERNKRIPIFVVEGDGAAADQIPANGDYEAVLRYLWRHNKDRNWAVYSAELEKIPWLEYSAKEDHGR